MADRLGVNRFEHHSSEHKDISLAQSIEQPDIDRYIPPEITKILKAHVVDIDPVELGRRELVKKMSDAAVGAMDAQVNRSDPPIQVDSLVASHGKLRVLFGPNGSGKSTVFDAIMDRNNAHFDTRSGQGALVYGKPVHAREKLRVSRLDQEELLGAINEFKAGAVLGHAADYFKKQFPIDWENPDLYDQNLANQDTQVRIEALVSQIAKLFDMDEFQETKVKNLSGGERTKLSLFMILLSEPDVLLLDEPTNHLDLRSIAKLTALFKAYKEAGISITSVSHVDWYLQDAGVDGVLELVWNKEGRSVHESSAPFGRYVKDASRERMPIISGDITWQQEGYGYKYGNTLVQAPEVFTVPDSPLKNIVMPHVHGGEMVIMTGDNGTGKTKLMETMVYNREPHMPVKQKGTQIAYLPQFWPEKVTRGNVGDFFSWVKDVASPHSTGSAIHKEKPPHKFFVEQASQLHFGGGARIGESWLRRPFNQLSGGEQRLLWFLAVSSLRDVDMLMLDEPTNHMDRDLQVKVLQAIRTFPGAVLLSTHDRNLITELATDAGEIHGSDRHASHLVLEKKKGQTVARTSSRAAVDYMNQLVEDARREAKKLKLTE